MGTGESAVLGPGADADVSVRDYDPVIGASARKALDEWGSGRTDEFRFGQVVSRHSLEVRHKVLFIVAIAAATLLISGISVSVGMADVGMADSFRVIWQHITGNVTDEVLDFLVVDYRLPRVAAGLITGCGLAVCGAVMQSILKNPLADPYVTGVSSGAAFGATFAMTVGMMEAVGGFGLVVTAFLCSMVPIAVIVAVSRATNASPTTMIMSGIGVMYIFNAFTTILMLWSDPTDLAGIYRWQIGSLAMISSWDNIPVMFAIVAVGVAAMFLLSGKLNILAIGDENARSMGIDADSLRVVSLILAGVVSAGVVSFTGLIGFVGLVAPHIVRMFVGSDNRYLLPASAAFGAMLLLIADTVGKAGIGGVVLQTGVVMALIGGPVFMWLILRRNSSLW